MLLDPLPKLAQPLAHELPHFAVTTGIILGILREHFVPLPSHINGFAPTFATKFSSIMETRNPWDFKNVDLMPLKFGSQQYPTTRPLLAQSLT